MVLCEQHPGCFVIYDPSAYPNGCPIEHLHKLLDEDELEVKNEREREELSLRLTALEKKDSSFTDEELEERNKIRKRLDELRAKPTVELSKVFEAIHSVHSPQDMAYKDKRIWGMAINAVLGAVKKLSKEENNGTR